LTGRFAQPEEIAHTVLHLVIGASGMLSCTTIAVDGGYAIV
jgi:NAD(P)-dependent dehydrogenase (short-subunit alcohol dehydrogenase family)